MPNIFTVEIKVVFDPADPDEAADIGPRLQRVLEFFRDHGIMTVVRQPTGLGAVDIIEQPAKPSVPTRRGNGKSVPATAKAPETGPRNPADPDSDDDVTEDGELPDAQPEDEDEDADPFVETKAPIPAAPSNQERKDKAIDLLSKVYQTSPDGKIAVKKLQRELGVTMFSDMPVAEGARLLTKAAKLAEKFGVQA